MAKKIALLIGISEYKPGIEPLPKSLNDVEAMRRVLVNPEMGNFAEADVTMLQNPSQGDMQDAIYNLYYRRDTEDLLLFYFSGHGMKEETGEFYLSTPRTEKNLDNKLIPTTAVPAKDVHKWMTQSKSKRQVVILDCCFSGAFAKGMPTKDIGTIDLQQYLGGEGRAILMASTSTQSAFAPDNLDLSIYTHYLVEGIEKGVADQDGDGLIAVDELHSYAKSKVQEESPAMTPELCYVKKDEYPIFLAKSPKDDPKLKYRKEVEQRIYQGKFNIAARRLLNSFRIQWHIAPDIADAIEAEVQQPYLDYQRKLKEYEDTLIETIADEPTLSQRTLKDLRDYQEHLGLRNEDVAPIEERIIGKPKPPELPVDIPVKPNYFDFEMVKVNAQGKIINRSQGQAEFFAEDLGNGVVLDMIAIPGGTFVMGSPESELERRDTESPQHNVTVPPFFMGKFPVTQAQWAAVAAFGKVNIDLKPDPSNFKGANRPVESVSWHDAVEFCARLSQKTGKTYRLPSEAEWEYACRAGTTTPFYCGETITTDLANYDGNYTYASGPKGEFREQTTDLGKFPANPFGLFDMCGNIWEWCQDEWHENYNNAPKDGSAWLIKNDYQDRLLRGGSRISNPRYCRSAYRNKNASSSRDDDYGFRVVISAART